MTKEEFCDGWYDRLLTWVDAETSTDSVVQTIRAEVDEAVRRGYAPKTEMLSLIEHLARTVKDLLQNQGTLPRRRADNFLDLIIALSQVEQGAVHKTPSAVKGRVLHP